MPEILTESFCERCGTRYTFEATAPVKTKKLGKFKTLSKGLKNYVLSDETSMDEAMAAARSDEERALTAHQLEAFQSTFNFCMTCRQYTCANCWNTAEGACLTCAPLNGYVTPSTTFLDLAPLVPIEPVGVGSSPWPTPDTSGKAAAAEAATPWPDEAPGYTTPSFLTEAAAEEAVSHANEATAWPIEAELAATADATSDAVSEPDVIAAEAVPAAEPEMVEAEPVLEAEAEPAPQGPEAADWAMAEAEASEEAQPVVAVEVATVTDVEPEFVEAAVAAADEVAVEAAATHVDEIALEASRTSAETFVFEPDIAPAVAELPDTDMRAADAARRTSDLLARLRPAPSTPFDAVAEAEAFAAAAELAPVSDEVPVDEPIAADATTPTDEAVHAPAEFAVSEFDVADYVIGDFEPANVAPEELMALDPWRDEPAAMLPADLLANIGPAIETVPEPVAEFVAEPLEVAAEAEALPEPVAEPIVEFVAEPVEVLAAELVDVPEPATAPVELSPEPVRTDIVEQPTWRIVAPDPTAPPTNGHTPHPEPVQPAVVAKAPAVPPLPVEPQWPTPPQAPALPDAPYLVSRRDSNASEGLWAASARGVVAPQVAGAPILAVQPCASCGLSLSATARFCRRCGTRQGA